jgi:hypothetical protein
VFIEEIFKFIQFEETLYFTMLDIKMNSFGSKDIIDESALLDINSTLLKDSFSCNIK